MDWACLADIGEERTLCQGVRECNGIKNCSSCGFYETQRETGEIIEACSSCHQCTSGIGYESDCSNIGFGKFHCMFSPKTMLKMPEGYGFEYTQWICPHEIGGRVLCLGMTCNMLGSECSDCGAYQVRIDSNEVIGQCSSCHVCPGDWPAYDCSNLGHGRTKCVNWF